MARPHFHVFLLLLVLSVFWCGCGGFNGVLAPTLSSITPTTVTAGGAAFTLTASGTNFGQGTTILWNGTALPTTVSSSTQLTAKVTAEQIANSGAVSIRVMKADTTTSGTLTLMVTGGAPGGSFALTSISPAAVAAGSTDFTLTAIGTGFVSGAAITLNGTAITTTFDSATQLHGTVPAAAVAAAGTINVGVTNPDKSTTNTLALTVISGGLGPAPTLTSINPNSGTAGQPDTPITATGTNFVSGSTIMWNGAVLTTTFNSSTQLTATIPASDFNIPPAFFDPVTGTATEEVFVLNPDSTVSNELPFTITLPPTTIPKLVTIFNPSKTQRSKVGDPGFTLTLCGSLFLNNATVNFGGTTLPASAVAPAGADCLSLSPATNQPTQQVTAQVPASALTSVAELKVTIQNPSSGPSNDIPYYVGMNVYFDESSDVVWDARNNLFYISKPSTAQKSKDAIVALSPSTGLNDAAAKWIYQLPAGSNPDRLALTPDGKYLYVGLDGTNQVQQLAITSGSTAPAAGATIPLGSGSSGPYFAMDMAVSPNSDTLVAVARGVDPSVSNLGTVALGGVAIYDATTQQPLPQVVGPSSVPGSTALLDTLQWPNATTIYAANNENATGDLYVLDVSPTGVALAANGDFRGVFTIPNLYIHMDAASGLLYGDDGLEVDPTVPKVNFSADANGIMAYDHAGGKAYFVYQPTADQNQLEYFVGQFDLATLALSASLDLYQVHGIPQHLVRWTNSADGTSGVAFTTKKFSCKFSPCTVGDGRLFVIDWP
jgi:trimeric autotransporter adhesin